MNKQSGSALFIILIAVALFAALGYAFMQGNRGSTSMMTDEAAKAYVTDITAYTNDIKMAVKRLTLKGCKDYQLSFSNSTYKHVSLGVLNFPDNHNPLAPTDGSCDVFKLAGGGMVAKSFPNIAVENNTGAWKAGDGGPVIVTVDGVGTSAPDLVMYFPKIKDQLCHIINKNQGFPDAAAVPSDSFEGWKAYTGVNTKFTTPPYGHVGNNNPLVTGKTSFCIRSDWGKNQGVYHVVILAR